MSGWLTAEALAELADQVAAVLADRQLVELQQPPVRRWLTIEEAADYIGAKPQRIYDLRSMGRLRRTGDGGRVLVDRRELDALIERGLT